MTRADLKEKSNGTLLDVLITEKGSRLSAENRYLLEVANYYKYYFGKKS